MLNRLLSCSHLSSPKQTRTMNPIPRPVCSAPNLNSDRKYFCHRLSNTACTVATILSVSMSHCLRALLHKMTWLCQLAHFVPTRHLFFPIPLLLYSLGLPQELFPYYIWQKIKRWWQAHILGHSGFAVDMQRSHKIHSVFKVQCYQLCTQIVLPGQTLFLHSDCCVSNTHTHIWLHFIFMSLFDAHICPIILLKYLCPLSPLKELAVADWAAHIRTPGKGLLQSCQLKSE